MNAASESWCVGGDVIVDSILASAATLFPSLLTIYTCCTVVCGLCAV
jgi:hypothetical protein